MKIIITEEQSKNLARALNEETYQMPQGIDKHENKPYTINPDKVKIVKNFLDTNFKKGNYDDIGPDGFPRRTKIVAMISPAGDVLRNMYQEDLLSLLVEKFKNMFLDHTERELFLKQVMKDWFDDKINVFGNLSVNRLLAENVENETRGNIDARTLSIENYILNKLETEGVNENGFEVPEEILKAGYPYKNVPKKIKVVFDNDLFLKDRIYARYLDKENTIVVSPEFLSYMEKVPAYARSIIHHELTHLINDNEGNGIGPITSYSFEKIPDEIKERVHGVIYLFRDTEMNARISEFASIMSSLPPVFGLRLTAKDIGRFEPFILMDKMRKLISECENDRLTRLLLRYNAKMNNGKLNGIRSVESLKRLYEKYKQKIYKVYFDGIEKLKELYVKQALQQSSLALNEITSEEVTIEANEANTNPTDPQKEAGNYKMGHVSVKGMKISIENPKGSKRRYKDDNGNEKYNVMKHHYGYFNVTKGKDGDAVDCFLGPNIEDFENVYCVDQNTKNGEFDETKVMLGFNSKEAAKEAYLSNYEPGWKGLRSITGVSLKTFKKWLYRGRKQRQPFADYVYIQKKKIEEQKKKNPTV